MGMRISWITLYPQWYVEERWRMATHYPQFWVDESALSEGRLCYYGNLKVRPSGGTVRRPVRMLYPEGTPFRPPTVTPLHSLPEVTDDRMSDRTAEVRMFDQRHQMPDGALCLFQRETRAVPGGDIVRGIDALKRAEQWFLGFHTGHWPPDSADSELEPHFAYATDVLLGDAFFSPDIEGHGRFFIVRDLRRLMDSGSRGVCPMIVTALTEETDVIKVFDAREDLSRVYPWIQDEAWSPVRIADIDDGTDDTPGMVEKGYWWSLPKEPGPFHDGAGLLEELAPIAPDGDAWAMVLSMLGGEISTSGSHLFGLRYPGRHGGVEWLMLGMHRGRRSGVPNLTDAVKRKEFQASRVGCVRVHSARPTELRFRNTGVVEDCVHNRVVALIGLGALGSTVAELLAKAGVGEFRLCDCDYLATGNVARHVGGLNEFGAPKTRVVMSRLMEINPYLTFSEGDVITGSAVTSLDGLGEFLAPADLTISTTADESVESIINQVAVIHRKPVVYGRALRRGSMGRVFLVRPGRDACKECLSEYARSGRQGEEVPNDWIDVIESEDDVLLHECGRPVIPASAIDMSFVAALIARVALDILEGGEAEANHWIWSRLPATGLHPRLDREMCTFLGRLEPRSGCLACQEPDVVGVMMSEEVRRTIVSTAESSPDLEAGGVLIGFVDEDRRAIALRATRPGPKAQMSESGFSRDVEHVQAALQRAESELGDHGAYIGEWHSHLVADPKPSAVDIESLFGISEAPHYQTKCPVMVIAGLDASTKKVADIKSWTFPVGGRVYTIETVTGNGDAVHKPRTNPGG